MQFPVIFWRLLMNDENTLQDDEILIIFSIAVRYVNKWLTSIFPTALHRSITGFDVNHTFISEY